MAVYGKLTKDEALSISYWDAITAWGISSLNYPQPYYPDGVCGCENTPAPTPTPSPSPSDPPHGIPEITSTTQI